MEILTQVEGKNITVLGAARSGVSVAVLLAKHGASVFLSEAAPVEKKREESAALDGAGIQAEFGGHSDRIFESDLWVISPGIPLDADIICRAKERSMPVFGELEIASRFCRAPIVAITGSNGKSTATELLGEVFRESGRPCVVAGNIGRPFSSVVEATEPGGVAVLEVSSFQLESIRMFRPKLAVFLNLTPDHLDRHGTMEEYGRLKSRIFENQSGSDVLVYNGCDSLVEALSRLAEGKRVVFGREDRELDCAFTRKDRMMCRIEGVEEDVLSCDAMGIRGEHNMMNGLAVMLTARQMGVNSADIAETFRNFRGLHHRLESVRTLNGVEWVNDSKATNVQSVWFALGSFRQPIILIAGGRDKDSDFSVLRERIENKTRAVLLLGEAASKMASAFDGIQGIERVGSLEEAVQRAKEMARSGDVVLLSPACASFDMFRDFEDRGDQFKRIVGALE